MYERPFTLEIIAPDRVVFSGEATSVSAPGVEGGFQVLVNHAPLLANLGVGVITVKTPAGTDTRYASSGGTAEVKENRVVLLVETAERGDEIDVKRAQASRDRARDRLHEHGEGVDLERAKVSLYRALNRLRVASRP
jgi:F-type H+-transporting ATPase subunit epsilon